MNALLIAATEEQGGKTILTSALAAYWQTYCADRHLGVMKLIQTQGGDRDWFARLFALDQSANELNPLSFSSGLVPPLSAQKEQRTVALEQVWQAFEKLHQQRDWLLLEAYGGLGSPVTRELSMADLAWDWRLPTVLVVPVKPGAIAQAVANVALARQARVHLKGIVLNCARPDAEAAIADWASPELIRSLTQKPVLGCIPYLTDLADLSKLAQVASNLDLEHLIPTL